MKQTIQLNIPESCHENWSKMTATQQGRFCMACQKEVIDFSVMSDSAILDYFSTAGTKTCGKFMNDQLNRALATLPGPRKTGWKYWVSVAASVVLLTSKSDAQMKTVKDTIVAVTPLLNTDEIVVGGAFSVSGTGNKAQSFMVAGVIRDENNSPIPGASIVIKNTKRGTVSDVHGNFKLNMSEGSNAVLQVFSIGYETQEISLTKNYNSLENIVVSMKTYLMGLTGEVVVVRKKRKLLPNFFKPVEKKCEKTLPASILQLYPNPVAAGSVLNIKMKDFAGGNYWLTVTDVNGNIFFNNEIIIASQQASTTIKCDQRFTGGMYTMQLSGNGKMVSAKFIVH